LNPFPPPFWEIFVFWSPLRPRGGRFGLLAPWSAHLIFFSLTNSPLFPQFNFFRICFQQSFFVFTDGNRGFVECGRSGVRGAQCGRALPPNCSFLVPELRLGARERTRFEFLKYCAVNRPLIKCPSPVFSFKDPLFFLTFRRV